jgi:exodeoxyribonuclease VII small subunit
LAKKRAPEQTPDFESALAELEALVERMEQGDVSLEESLQLFERGVNLTRTCQLALKAAEQKVQILLEKTPTAEAEDFNADD